MVDEKVTRQSAGHDRAQHGQGRSDCLNAFTPSLNTYHGYLSIPKAELWAQAMTQGSQEIAAQHEKHTCASTQ